MKTDRLAIVRARTVAGPEGEAKKMRRVIPWVAIFQIEYVCNNT